MVPARVSGGKSPSRYLSNHPKRRIMGGYLPEYPIYMAQNRASSTVGVGAGTTTLTGEGKYLHAINLTGAGYVSFRFDGTTAVLAADETYGVGKTQGATTVVRIPQRTGNYVISHIADVATVCLFALSDSPDNI